MGEREHLSTRKVEIALEMIANKPWKIHKSPEMNRSTGAFLPRKNLTNRRGYCCIFGELNYQSLLAVGGETQPRRERSFG